MQRFPKFRDRAYLVAPNAPPLAPHRSLDGIGTIPLDLLLVAAGVQFEKELADRLA